MLSYLLTCSFTNTQVKWFWGANKNSRNNLWTQHWHILSLLYVYDETVARCFSSPGEWESNSSVLVSTVQRFDPCKSASFHQKTPKTSQFHNLTDVRWQHRSVEGSGSCHMTGAATDENQTMRYTANFSPPPTTSCWPSKSKHVHEFKPQVSTFNIYPEPFIRGSKAENFKSPLRVWGSWPVLKLFYPRRHRYDTSISIYIS